MNRTCVRDRTAVREGCSVWGTLIFKKNGVSKAQFFLASQGRRLEAGAAKAPRGRRGQGFTVWYSVGWYSCKRITFDCTFRALCLRARAKSMGYMKTWRSRKVDKKYGFGSNMRSCNGWMSVTRECPPSWAYSVVKNTKGPCRSAEVSRLSSLCREAVSCCRPHILE